MKFIGLSLLVGAIIPVVCQAQSPSPSPSPSSTWSSLGTLDKGLRVDLNQTRCEYRLKLPAPVGCTTGCLYNAFYLPLKPSLKGVGDQFGTVWCPLNGTLPDGSECKTGKKAVFDALLPSNNVQDFISAGLLSSDFASMFDFISVNGRSPRFFDRFEIRLEQLTIYTIAGNRFSSNTLEGRVYYLTWEEQMAAWQRGDNPFDKKVAQMPLAKVSLEQLCH